VFVDGIGFGVDSIVSAKIGPGINYMGMPGASSYSWVESNSKFRETDPT
jgi:hypothetical protein